MITIYPGSFDPITYGHLDIIKRASQMCSKLYIAVLINKDKEPYFDNESRVRLIKETTKGIKNIEVITFDGLLVDIFKHYQIDAIIKGLRAISDFEYEFQMAQINKELNNKAETLFMMTNPKFSYLSSSVVKQIHYFGGDIDKFVPSVVVEEIKKRRLL